MLMASLSLTFVTLSLQVKLCEHEAEIEEKLIPNEEFASIWYELTLDAKSRG